MMLNDYECDTCGKKFEHLSEESPATVPCIRSPVCTGVATRLLGGRPQVSTKASAVPTNTGDYECHLKVVKAWPFKFTSPSTGKTVEGDVALVKHEHVPRAKALSRHRSWAKEEGRGYVEKINGVQEVRLQGPQRG